MCYNLLLKKKKKYAFTQAIYLSIDYIHNKHRALYESKKKNLFIIIFIIPREESSVIYNT